MRWIELITQADVDILMELFGNFHDGCLKEIKYSSGAYVEKNLSMHPINSHRVLYVVIQRQNKFPSAIEIIFEGLIKLNLEPNDIQYDAIIYRAYIKIIDNIIYWSDKIDFDPDNPNSGTWIAARNAKWRIADEYLGKDEVYISR